ncbi:MAG: Spy/CpxP family protein refolding chaperone [Acidobacteria bacterium]|nr:Spy/CpxP family protein refolding chaperone [Acidobacteriota bacterium]MCA1609527.1 Spy/CpxP family protein refolding chaperone [Acidobacteriota bacterium]
MKRLNRIASVLAFALLASAAPAPALLGDGLRAAGHARQGGGAFALHSLHRCAALLDLNSDQKAAVDGIFAAVRPSLQADREALKAARRKVEADVGGGADKTVLGEDVLARHAAAQKLHTDIAAVQDQVTAKLTPDQQSRLQGCLSSARSRVRS